MEEEVLEALERKRHKGDPFGQQFVKLATAPFGAPSNAGPSSEVGHPAEETAVESSALRWASCL